MSSKFDELIDQAARTLAQMNKDDRESGFMPDEEESVPSRLRTVAFALEAGLKTEDWNCIAEAYLMLKATNNKISAETNLCLH